MPHLQQPMPAGESLPLRLCLPSDFNYSSYYLDEDFSVDSYTAAAQVVTMSWVVAWFSEEMWRAKGEI
jgi:hypothetical protein